METKEVGKLDFLNLPYSDRQLIVVNDDEVVTSSRIAEAKEKEKNQNIDWDNILEIIIPVFSPGFGLMYKIGKEAIKAWGKARRNGLPILQLSVSESKNIKFQPGHPRKGVLYIGHPAIANVYHTMAEFHRVIFEHKFCEAINLLMYLGVTKIKVEYLLGWSKSFSSKLSVPLGGSTKSIGGNTGIEKNSEEKLLYEANFSGKSEMQIPKNLVWFPHESTWQSIAEGRIKFGLKDFSLSICYKDDFGINSELKASVLESGLKIGGGFEKHESTVWCITGEFKE